MNASKWIPRFVLAGLLGLGFYFLAREVLLNPNHVYLKSSGDAFKNYYTPWYHVDYDSTYWHFEGMNYPYGDHLIFTDAQPAFSNIFRFIDRNLIDVGNKTVGLLHMMIIFSYFGCGFFLFAIFRKLKVPDITAAVFAAGITLLSPQLLRIPGHYALAYLTFIPGLWWMYIRWFEKRNLMRAVAVAAWILFWAFVHPYYLLISTLFIGFSWILSFLYREFRRDWRKLLPALFIQVILPLLMFKGFLSLTDGVGDRPAEPHGYFEYRANWASIFLPMYLPHIELLAQLTELVEVHWEGVAYVSLAGTGAGIFFLGRSTRRLIRPKTRRKFLLPSTEKWLSVTVLASLMVMLFAQRYPFVNVLTPLVDHIPYLNQFRSIGRFAWVFYYVWTVYTCYLAYLGFRKWNGSEKMWKKLVGWGLPLLVLGIFFAEGALWNHWIREEQLELEQIPELGFQKERQSMNEWLKVVEPKEYAALMVIPYFHLGSENFTFENEPSQLPAMTSALNSGLPLLNVMMSRTSLSQTWSHLQLISEEYQPLAIMEHWAEEKPLLIMSLKKVVHDRPYYLPSRGELVFENEEMALYRVEKQVLEEFGTGEEAAILKEFAGIDTLYQHPSGHLMSQPDLALYYDPLEDMEFEEGYRGKGTERRGWDYNYLYRNEISPGPAGNYNLSVWVYLQGDLRPLTELGLELFHGDSVSFYHYTVTGSLVRIIDGGWGLVEATVPVRNPDDFFRGILRRDSKKPKLVRYDEVLFRQSSTDAWLFRDGELVKNNRSYPLNGQDEAPLLEGKVLMNWTGTRRVN